MKYSVGAVVFLFSVLCYSQAENSEKVKLSVFYETLCPGCQYFESTSLYDTYKLLHDNLELELVPFGNAKYTKVGDKYTFKCQHGEKECYGNKFHSCAIDMYTTNHVMDLLKCVSELKEPTSDEVFEKCSKSSGMSFKDLKKCVEVRGDALLAKNGERSSKVGYNFVPAMTFNDGKFDGNFSVDAMRHLTATVCSFYKSPPKQCKNQEAENFGDRKIMFC